MNYINHMTLCIVIHLLLFGFLPTSSGLTGLYFGLHKRSETGSVWSSVFTDTCSYKHTLIPHVVVYRPCLYIQRLGFNIYCWTHVVFTVHLYRLSGLFMSNTVWFIFLIKKMAYDRKLRIGQIFQCFFHQWYYKILPNVI